LAGTETTVLGDLVETIRPQYLTAAGNEAEATFAEVSVTDFGDDGYVQTPRKVVRVDRDMIGRAERQRLAPLDVVLVIKGSVGRVGLVPSDLSEAWIANQSCLILRLHKYGPLRSPIVLARYLLSPLGQALLGKIATSATVPTLQIRDLKALPVIIPDQAEQSAILDTDQELFALGREITQAQERLALLHGRHWPL